ncbi:MAG TPA: DNA methyltransferase [Gaiellaceae bacterium]
MGQKQAVDELGLDHEQVLPLTNLSGIVRGDALKIEWPRADAIISNPPYHGDRRLRGELGDDYVEWLKAEFKVGVKDYCVYWFRKAHDRLVAGGRAGLVGTNSISQNRGRGASLDYVVENGGVITNAISSQDWSGEAAVDVSIVNWVKRPMNAPPKIALDGTVVESIASSLRPGQEREPTRLTKNARIAYQGMLPGANYLVDAMVAKRLRMTAHPPYAEVIRPYLVGDDIANDPEQAPSRYIVDFGVRSLEEAMGYPDALQIIGLQARHDRETSRSYSRNPRWWQFLWPRPVFRQRLSGLSRYLAGTATGKRILFCWCDLSTVASNATNVFALDDDFFFGIMTSRPHTAWAATRSSTLENRIRYTPSSAFETFPFPQPSDKEPIAEVSRRLIARRSEICLERQIGLTKLYNEVDDGAYRDLSELHVALDEAVAAAYGWPASAAHDPQESNRLLLELNREIAAGRVPYDPFR